MNGFANHCYKISVIQFFGVVFYAAMFTVKCGYCDALKIHFAQYTFCAF